MRCGGSSARGRPCAARSPTPGRAGARGSPPATCGTPRARAGRRRRGSGLGRPSAECTRASTSWPPCTPTWTPTTTRSTRSSWTTTRCRGGAEDDDDCGESGDDDRALGCGPGRWIAGSRGPSRPRSPARTGLAAPQSHHQPRARAARHRGRAPACGRRGSGRRCGRGRSPRRADRRTARFRTWTAADGPARATSSAALSAGSPRSARSATSPATTAAFGACGRSLRGNLSACWSASATAATR
mmetsp:Transcript_30519/g.94271  ORF Transcript_30519/g.94271 Transcript_30519/m.94271 type:complete len:243 (-) Transcript_30519:1409-2137(-)